MNATIENGRMPNFQTEARDITAQQMRIWFAWMDRILDVHRGNFVFREPTPSALEEHKQALKNAIRYCLLISALISDPDFKDPDLVSQLQVRIQQLQDAYDTFHDESLSDDKAERVLHQVFPE